MLMDWHLQALQTISLMKSFFNILVTFAKLILILKPKFINFSSCYILYSLLTNEKYKTFNQYS